MFRTVVSEVSSFVGNPVCYYCTHDLTNFRDMVSVNVSSVINVTLAVLPGMVER